MIDESALSDEQRAILNHPTDSHGRVLAGPGTGKSFTATLLLGRLIGSAEPKLRAKMLTFTRAATAEFAIKLEEAGLRNDVEEPATVHSHALAILLGMHDYGLPEPLRIPDSWESTNLVHHHIARLLKSAGYDATPKKVKKLEREMAAGWETLTEGIVMEADINPLLRAAYVGTWNQHRRIFGYTLLAELPYRAGVALEELGTDQPPKLDLLLVDEYQDLNAADIRFVKAHADLGVRILAIGDDDQSIYGWRYADPSGILDFGDDFAPYVDYNLSISRRCGQKILDAANELIASAPGRHAKPPLSTLPGSPDGFFRYFRFLDGAKEAAAAASIAAARVRNGVSGAEILVLVRSQENRWRNQLQPFFEAEGLTLSSVDWVADAMTDRKLRTLIALARLHGDQEDSLAWWAVTEKLTPGVGPSFTDYVYDNREQDERWGHALLRLFVLDFPGLTRGTAAKVKATMGTVLLRLSSLTTDLATWALKNPETPWSDWIISEIDSANWHSGLSGSALSEESRRLLEFVGPKVPQSSGLQDFLNQLEPVGKDLATEESGGVRLMNISKSKGLTADTAIIMGLEEGLIPLGKAKDLDEERRLLYVALTRARNVCVATIVSRRTGPLARSGGGRTHRLRLHSSLIDGFSFGSPEDGRQLSSLLATIESI